MATREEMIEELRSIEGSYNHSITPAKRRRARELVKLLTLCECRLCGKQYNNQTTKAEYTGYCSAKCLHQSAREVGWRKGHGPEFDALKRSYGVGNVFVHK